MLTHVGVFTNDLERLKEFYEAYFGGISNSKYHNIKTNFESYFLKFDGECSLEIMTKPSLDDLVIKELCGINHIAFNVGGNEKVDKLTNKLVSDGYILLSGPRMTGDGYYEACIQDPDGNKVEIVG